MGTSLARRRPRPRTPDGRERSGSTCEPNQPLASRSSHRHRRGKAARGCHTRDLQARCVAIPNRRTRQSRRLQTNTATLRGSLPECDVTQPNGNASLTDCQAERQAPHHTIKARRMEARSRRHQGIQHGRRGNRPSPDPAAFLGPGGVGADVSAVRVTRILWLDSDRWLDCTPTGRDRTSLASQKPPVTGLGWQVNSAARRPARQLRRGHGCLRRR